jgi:hypothetical protein
MGVSTERYNSVEGIYLRPPPKGDLEFIPREFHGWSMRSPPRDPPSGRSSIFAVPRKELNVTDVRETRVPPAHHDGVLPAQRRQPDPIQLPAHCHAVTIDTVSPTNAILEPHKRVFDRCTRPSSVSDTSVGQ